MNKSLRFHVFLSRKGGDNTRKKILERRAKEEVEIKLEDISEEEELTAFEEE